MLSDEFGLDDDDTAWLDAATQAEASQAEGDFDLSPRPHKRRKSDEIDPESDLEDDEGYYLPGELGDDNSKKTSKYKIHIPEGDTSFGDLLVSQTQHDLDDDPTAIRGPIWKRPQPLSVLRQAQAQNVRAALQKSGPATSVKSAAQGINGYFQNAAAPRVVEDDATMAARLQRQEERFASLQAKPAIVSKPPVKPLPDSFAIDLTDLPSDAFSSQIETSPAQVERSPSAMMAPNRAGTTILRGPQAGLKQTTLLGQMATQDITASQAANKRHAWPLKSKDEPMTHHKLDPVALASWIYPTNLGTVRDYQFNIVSRSLFHNTLVALPTGLGKTFIAATVMLNYYRWCPTSQIVFMAPTKPLIAQQMEACYGIVGIARRDTVLMTGETAPGLRAEEWLDRRVFFMTPQTVINDLKTGICDPKKIVLLVVDEAHKATGGYAYTEVIAFMRRFNPSFRVLALTATPGSTIETVQAVIDNLGIARVELRTEQSIDIRPYTHEKLTEQEIFEYSDEQERIMELYSKALRDTVNKLKSHNAYWQGDPMSLTAFGLTLARKKWMATDAGRKAPKPIQGMINAAFQQLSKLAHGISLLKNHGIQPFYANVSEYRKAVESGQEKGKTATAIVHSESFTKMMTMVRTWTSDTEFIGHPKLEYLREVVLNHFLDAGEGRHGSQVTASATRIMIFASYRDSTEEIVRVLKRNEPMVRPHVFVGQAASKESEGMNQKRQNQVIQDFKSGKINTLVATSIGEEGLDIGTVDLIICYDSSSSPIRMLQRVGRTGRKRVGRVVLLLMKGKEQDDYAKSQDNYLYIQKSIADAQKYTYHEEQSPRILPKEAQPFVDKRPVEIPVENTQPIDLNEKARKGRGKAKPKRPPKKFHMPDGVRTTFVKASKLGSDEEDAAEPEPVVPTQTFIPPAKRKPTPKKVTTTAAKRKVTPEPEVVHLPFIKDVLLTPSRAQDLAQKYAQTAEISDEAVLRVSDSGDCLAHLQNLGSTRYIPYGRAALVQKTVRSLRSIDEDRVKHAESHSSAVYASELGSAAHRLVSPEASAATATRSILARSVSLPEDQSGDESRATDVRTEDADLTVQPARKPRGRPKKNSAQDQASPKAAIAARQHAVGAGAKALSARVSAKVTKKPNAGRPKKAPARSVAKATPQRQIRYGSSAEEGAESSPEPTPADMRIGTQGIDIGTQDTSGEDEEEPDSDLDGFIAGSSDPIEMVSSSQDGLLSQDHHRRSMKKVRDSMMDLSDVEEADETAASSAAVVEEEPVIVAKTKRRRIVADSDSDE